MKELKVGMSLWTVYADPEYGVELQEWVISSIKRPNTKHKYSFRPCPECKPIYVYIIRKDEYTWVKKSKHHDSGYGWDKSISKYDRNYFPLDDYNKNGLPRTLGLSFTKEGAYKQALFSENISLKNAKAENDTEWIEQQRKLIGTIKSCYSRLKNKKKAP